MFIIIIIFMNTILEKGRVLGIAVAPTIFNLISTQIFFRIFADENKKNSIYYNKKFFIWVSVPPLKLCL